MPQPIFSGVKMTYDVVHTYYGTIANFDHFVFQPMIDDLDAGNFTLAAYAVAKDLTVLNNGAMLPTTELDGNGFPGGKPNIQFANMNLDLDALKKLYPEGGAKSDLSVHPAGGYYKQNGQETAYVSYVAETGNRVDIIVTSSINPSPPA